MPYLVALESIVAMAIVGGVALWCGRPPGFLLSSLIQLMQVAQVIGQRFTFTLLLGPSLGLVLPSYGPPTRIHVDLGARLAFAVRADNLTVRPGLIINVMALATLLTLVRLKARNGQPWLSPRNSRTPWDAARVIGAYQITAGSYGILSAATGTAADVATPTVLFSIVVIASGIALVYRARWSGWVAVAVNALQVPVIHAASWALILNSGLSFDVLATSDDLLTAINIGGLVNQLDISDVTGLTVNSFVGMNIVAFALAIVLTVHQVKIRAASRKPAVTTNAKAVV